MIRKALLALALIGLVGGVINATGAAADDRAATARATSAAHAWLKLIDNRDYAGSWQAASELFQHGGDADTWTRQVAAVVSHWDSWLGVTRRLPIRNQFAGSTRRPIYGAALQ